MAGRNVGGFPGDAVVKKSLASAGDPRDVALIPGLRRSPEGGSGSRLQHSCLEKPMDRRAWQAAAHGVTKGRTRLSGSTQAVPGRGDSLREVCSSGSSPLPPAVSEGRL